MNTKNINIFCMNCGRRLTDDAQFCPSCGAEVVRFERSEQPKQQGQHEQTDRYATQYAEDPAPYEQFEPYDTPRYAPPPSEPAARGQEVPKSLYAIVLSLTLAGMIVVGVIGGMIIHFTRSGGEKVQTAQSESAAAESDNKPAQKESNGLMTYPEVGNEFQEISASGISAQYGVLLDCENNEMYAGKNYDEKAYLASLSKLMTVIVALEQCNDLSDTYEFTDSDIKSLKDANTSVAGFCAGEKVTIEDMLYGATLPSGADAALGLAKYISGSEDEFVKLMNDKVEELGLIGTHFTNVYSLHDEEEYSTALDMALIVEYALNNDKISDEFIKIISAKDYTTSKNSEHKEGLDLNSIFMSRYDGFYIDRNADGKKDADVIGGKTGYTEESGYSLASVYKIEDTYYVCVTMKSSTAETATSDNITIAERYLPVYDMLDDDSSTASKNNTTKKTTKKTTTTQPQTAPQPSGDESAAAARAGKSNIVNGGYAVSDGEYIYSSCGTLTRRRADGGGEEKLLDTQVYYLNVSGGWLYFTSVDENNAVCRMRTDGSGYEVLCSKYSYELTLYGGRLYFSADMGGAGYEICRMDTDGGDFTVLAANRAWYMNICDDLIFFCDYNGDKYSLKSMTLDGSGMQTLYASPCSDICAANGRVYFSADRDKRSLYSMAYDGSDLKKLRSGYTKHTNYTEGRLYFTDKNGNICSMNADGGGEETLKSPSGGAAYLVFILPDNYFYMDNSGDMHNVQ